MTNNNTWDEALQKILSQGNQGNIAENATLFTEDIASKKTIFSLVKDIIDQKIKGTYYDQLFELRKGIFEKLTILVIIETIALFLIVTLILVLPVFIPELFCVKFPVLSDSTLQILVGATIAQISAMLFFIVQSLFSEEISKAMK